MARALDLDSRISFVGFVDRIGDVLASVDAVVHASVLPEPFGQVVVEGMAAGLPVIAADAGGPAETIDDEVTGLLYPPGDVDALAERLLRLARDEELRKRLGANARRAARRFAPEALAPQVVNVYREVLRGASR